MTQADSDSNVDPPKKFDLASLEHPSMKQQIFEHLQMEQQVRIAQQDTELARGMALRFERELDEERKRIARDVGEGLSDQVATLKTLAQTLEKRLATSEPSLAQLAGLIRGNADALLAHIRHIVRRVRPETLVGDGLVSAARALIEDWRLRRPQQRFEFLTEPADDKFGLGEPDVEALAFRLVELALQDATQADLWSSDTNMVLVSLRREAGQLTVQVAHQGRARQRESEGMSGPGWTELIERLKALAGHVHVGSGDAGGFELIAVLPWPLAL